MKNEDMSHSYLVVRHFKKIPVQTTSKMAPPWPLMRFGKMEPAGALSSSEQARADSTFDDYKKLQELLDVTDGFTSLPNASMRSTFDRSLRQAEDSISSVFFNKNSKTCIFGGIQYSSVRNEVASHLMTKSISKVNEYNFYKTVNGNQAQSKWHDIVHGESGRELGNSLLTQDLIDNHGFQFYLDDKAKWRPMLESLFQDEVYIIGTIVKELAMNVNLPGKMKFFVLQALGSSKIDLIADKWIACSSKDIVQPCLDFIKTVNHMEFISAWLEDDPYYYDVRNACNKDTSHAGVNYISHHYGIDVIKWLKDSTHGPMQYGISVDTSDLDCLYFEYPSACFLSGTVVTNAEGTDTCIESLQENDFILGRAGNVGVMSSEKTGITLTAPTPAFGFNDDEPFFLSSHPFWSQDGWRAINPVVARDENNWLEIGALHVGDYVCKAKSVNGQSIEYEWVKIERFTTKIYPAGTRFYGIHTREGPRSYHANKYLVMQNYPEITIQRVADRMAKLERKTQQAVQKELNRIKPTLRNVLGDGAAEAVSSLASKRVLRQLTKSSNHTMTAVQSKDFTLPPLALKYETKNVSYGSYKMPTLIMIHRRQLYVDKKFVKEMLISSEREVSWCRRVEDGLWEHGCVKLYDNNMAGSGFIALTKNKNDEEALLHAELRAHFKVVIYNCDKSNEEIDPPPDKDDAKSTARLPRTSLTWEHCGSFEMGFVYDPDMQLWAAVDIGKLGGRDPLGGCIKLGEDKEQQLTVDIQVPPKFAKYTQHTRMFGTFNAFYDSFNGYCTEYDADADDLSGKTYGWRGTYDSWQEYDDDELEEAKQELLKSKIHSMANIGLSTCGVRGNLKESNSQVSSRMAVLLKDKVKSSLSLDDLFTLTPPDSTELHDRTFALMEKCMKYEMSDEDRAAVLGDSKPILSGAEEAVAEAHKEFIGTRFAHCYLMNALSRQESFKSRITETQRNQLLYFFAGNDKDGCMSTDQDYRSANNDLARQAFIGLCPRVQDYIDNDGPGWAEKLHKYITSPEKLLQFAIISEVDQDSAKIQKQAMVLYCLDPDQDLGLDFYNKVMMTKLQSNFDYFNGSDDCIDDMIDIIGDILEVLVQTILAGDDKELVGDIVQQCQEELKELQAELDQYGKDMMATMVDFVTQVVKRGGFSGDFWDRYFSTGKNILDNMQPKIVGKALKWMCGMVLPSIAFFFTLKAFTNFDELTPEQRASVILDASNAALSMINKGGPKLLDKFKECFGKGSGDFKFVTMLDDAERSGVTLTRLTRLTESAGSAAAGESLTVEQAVANSMAGTGGDIAVVETRWSKAFKYVGKLAKFTGILASFAGAIATGLQLFRDIKNGASPAVIAFDVIETAAFSMVAICEVLTLTIECQAIPIVGQVCAVVGLVAAIILLFIHDPPDNRTPAEKYCDDRGGPYIDELKVPSQEWLDEYHEQHPDD